MSGLPPKIPNKFLKQKESWNPRYKDPSSTFDRDPSYFEDKLEETDGLLPVINHYPSYEF
jgi:hypothetical protein